MCPHSRTHARTHTHTHTVIHTHTHTQWHTHTHAQTHSNTHIHTHALTHTHTVTHTHTHTRWHTHTRTHRHTQILTYTCMHWRTHIHTQIYVCEKLLLCICTLFKPSLKITLPFKQIASICTFLTVELPRLLMRKSKLISLVNWVSHTEISSLNHFFLEWERGLYNFNVLIPKFKSFLGGVEIKTTFSLSTCFPIDSLRRRQRNRQLKCYH